MKTLFNQSVEKLEMTTFELLNEKEMDQLKGGLTKERDVFDPDEH